jgi:hypothetical protein
LPFGAAAWLTLTLRPATTTLPLRADPVLAAMAKRTVPEPAPLATPLTVAHETFDDDVQAHPAVVVTLRFTNVAVAEVLTEPGDTE